MAKRQHDIISVKGGDTKPKAKRTKAEIYNDVTSNVDIMTLIYSQIEIHDIGAILSVILVERKAFECIKEHCLRLLLIIGEIITRVDGPYTTLKHRLDSRNSTSKLIYIIGTITNDYTTLFNRENVIFFLTLMIDIMANSDDNCDAQSFAGMLKFSRIEDMSKDRGRNNVFKNYTFNPIQSTTQLWELLWIDRSDHRVKKFSELNDQLKVYTIPTDRRDFTVTNEIEGFALESSTGSYGDAIFYKIFKDKLPTHPAKADDLAIRTIVNGKHLFSSANSLFLMELYAYNKSITELEHSLISGDLQNEWRKHVIVTNLDYCTYLLNFFRFDRIKPIITSIHDTFDPNQFTPNLFIDLDDQESNSEIGIPEPYEYPSSLDNTDSIIETDDSKEERYVDDEEEEEEDGFDDDDDDDDDEEEEEYEEDWSLDESSSFSLSTPSTTNDSDEDDDDDEDNEDDDEDEEISTRY